MNTSTGQHIANFLSTRGAVGVQDSLIGSTVWLSPLDWDFVPDAKYVDRLCAFPKAGPARFVGKAKFDLSHRRLYGPDCVLYWEPITASPAYASIPTGEINAKPELEGVEVGSEYRTTEDANYYGGECIPAGTVLTAAGYKTTSILKDGRLVVAFEPIAEFPDGSYRCLPLSVELVGALEMAIA